MAVCDSAGASARPTEVRKFCRTKIMGVGADAHIGPMAQIFQCTKMVGVGAAGASGPDGCPDPTNFVAVRR